jgi:hypothetical protein
LKIQKDREALKDMKGDAERPPAEEEMAKRPDDQPSSTDGKGDKTESGDKSSSDTDASDAATKAEDMSEGESEEPTDEEAVRAEAEAKQKEQEAEEATEEAREITERIADLQKMVSHEQNALVLTRKKADLALATQRLMEQELERKRSEWAPDEELHELSQGIAEARQRFVKSPKRNDSKRMQLEIGLTS